MDSCLCGNDGRFCGRFGLSGALIIKTRLPCSMGGCRSREYACRDKPRPRFTSAAGRPNVTSDSRGTVIEALCERYKLPPVVGFPGS